MFTGLVQGVGRVVLLERSAKRARLEIATPLAERMSSGGSIAVNGVCLTASRAAGSSLLAEAMNETLERTSLGELGGGDPVNLELPLRAGDPLGGHIVQGHVDGIGTIVGVGGDGFARVLEIEASADLLRYVAEKGSIAVDGVSLTVAATDSSSFTVSLIPETLTRTNLGQHGLRTRVNLEVDVLAKYVERLMAART